MPSYNIPLTGSNYISDERRQAFQDALDDDHQVSLPSTEQSMEPPPEPSPPPTPGETRSHPRDEPAGSQQLLETISLGLQQVHDHQAQTMAVHEQFLAGQEEYARLLSRLLENQGQLLRNGKDSAQNGAMQLLDQNLARVHNIQEHSLDVHQQFLDQQQEYSRSFVDLLEKQHGVLGNGNGKAPAFFSPAASPAVDPGEPTSGNQQQIAPSRHPETQATDPHRSGTQGSSSAGAEAHQPVGREPHPAVHAGKTAARKQVNRQDSPPEMPAEEPSPQRADKKTGPETIVSLPELTTALLEIVADKTGYPVEMLELEMDMEADLGIDSIKRVEILGALEAAFPQLPEADTQTLAELRTLGEIVNYMDQDLETPSSQPPAQPADPERETGPSAELESEAPEDHAGADRPGPDSGQSGELTVEQLPQLLLEIVSDKTGYPAEMLELEMDMEADLGIDSIKRVEILGAMEEQVPELPPFATESLAELRTLGQVLEYIETQAAAPAPVEPAAPPGSDQAPEKKSKTQELEIHKIRLLPLPPPDQLAQEIPEDRPLVISGDSSPLADQLAELLHQDGWKVVLWGPGDSGEDPVRIEKAENFPRLQHSGGDLDKLRASLRELKENYGPPAGFIHLHPKLSDQHRDFSPQERKLIKQVFFTAQQLENDLQHSPPQGRTFFLAVTQVDGNLGLHPDGPFQLGSGLPGLIKTLRREWPTVFCRAVDLAPQLSPKEQARAVRKEIYDPDQRLVEIAVNVGGRWTLDEVMI